MKRLKHTKDSLALAHFADRNSIGWHSFRQSDRRTLAAVVRATLLGAIEVNGTLDSFKSKLDT